MLSKNNKIKNINFQKGAVSVLFGILLLSILLVISSTMFVLMFQQIKMSGQTGRSVVALYAAEAGAERCLYEVRNNMGTGCDLPGGSIISGNILNGQASYETTYNGVVEINSIGRFLGTTRKLKLNW